MRKRRKCPPMSATAKLRLTASKTKKARMRAWFEAALGQGDREVDAMVHAGLWTLQSKQRQREALAGKTTLIF